MKSSSRLSASFVVVAAILAPSVARAWIYPEHRDIAAAAVERLSPSERAALEKLWADARPAFPPKVCVPLSAGDQGLRPECIDFPAFPALSGDHSCSPKALAEKVLSSEWVLDVARASAETKAALAGSGTRVERLNASATNNLKLQVVDPEYATRAGANNAHFLLPRTGDDLNAYVISCLTQGAPLNALGLYGQYHLAALGLAQRLASGDVPAAERVAMARDVIALEGFALHWLEDIYSSGHDVGTWGNAAWRKGTHDYYSEFGVDTVDWNGRTVLAYGDSNMKPADLERASTALAASLRQLASALRPGDDLGQMAQSWGPGAEAILAFDSCNEVGQPSTNKPLKGVGPHFADQVGRMPRPSLGPGEIHLPRYRDELGPFVGAYGTLSGGVTWGSAAGTSATGSVGAGARLGFGADSLTGLVGTGIAFVEVGLLAETAQQNQCGTAPGCATVGSAALFPRIPARTGLSMGIRMPFWVIPGDMIILGPILALASPAALSKVGVEAASGGLIPYERSIRTDAGIFQVIAGREMRVILFGLGNPLTGVVPNGTLPDGSSQYAVIQYTSVQLEFPVMEWTPFRTFATQLTFAAQLQLGFSVALPSAQVVYPTPGPFSSNPAWSVWLRGTFDGRYFFGSREDLESPR